jgi:hypothetical protein
MSPLRYDVPVRAEQARYPPVAGSALVAAMIGGHLRDSVPEGVGHGLRPIAQPRLGEEVVDVGLDRRLRDVERAGDLGVGPALGDQPQDLDT